MKVAIVEDEREAAKALEALLRRFADERSIRIDLTVYQNPMDFLKEPPGRFQLIFMDIDMPQLDGMSTAARLCEKDQTAALIFTTVNADLKL